MQLLTVPDLDGATGVLLSTDRLDLAQVTALLADLKGRLEQRFGVTSAIGVSEAHSLSDVASCCARRAPRSRTGW